MIDTGKVQDRRKLEKGKPAEHESPAFGKLSEENRVKLNLRRAELHLSFFQP